MTQESLSISDIVDEGPDAIPDLIGIGAHALVGNAKALGLTWTLRMATIVDGSTPGQVTILCDGDTEIIAAVSMVGELATSSRAYVVTVPPSGIFIVGRVWLYQPELLGIVSRNAAFAAGTTTSATYVDAPGPVNLTLAKHYLNTRIEVNLHATFQSSLANTSGRWAINIAGVGDGDIAQLVINPASTHLQVSGTAVFPAAVIGNIVLTARWRRVAGGGTLTVATDDWISITAREVI